MIDALLFAWSNFVKLFFLFCPFFVLNMFLSLTEGASRADKRYVAIHVTYVVLIVAVISYFAGNAFLNLFGLDLDGFRIGSGVLLMIMAQKLALGSETPTATSRPKSVREIIVVPLAIPIIMGPACVSPIIIIGAEALRAPEVSWFTIAFGIIGFLVAILALGTILYFSEALERLFGKNIIRIFSKISGVILMAMAAQMIARGFFAFLDKSTVGTKILEAITQ
ncbi:MAG: MarC family protein [Kiritimatiellae bacterium]|nr:MarC family protein [Kiritimatiellia bacterium]